MIKVIGIFELLNVYSPCFDLLVIFLIVIFIIRYDSKNESLKESELFEFEHLNKAKKWFIDNKSNLKEYKDEYKTIEDIDILELEKVRIESKIKMNLSKIKVNASFSDYVIQFVLLLLSFGLGAGILQNIGQGTNDILNRGLGVLANVIVTLVLGTWFIDSVIFIVLVSFGIPYFCFKNIMKRKEKQNEKLLAFNEQLEIRIVAVQKRINEIS